MLGLLLAAGADPAHALPAAVAAGDVDLVRRLLARGADPAAGLYTAASGGDASVAALAALLDAGADPNAGLCPFAAPRDGRPAVRGEPLKVVARVGFLLGWWPAAGGTALHAAARAGSPAAVVLLLARGADPDAPDADGVGPLGRALRNGRPPEAEQACRLLLAAGAAADRRDRRGRTSLHGRAGRCDVPAMALLLGAGADPDAADADGWRPQHWVAVARREWEYLGHPGWPRGAAEAAAWAGPGVLRQTERGGRGPAAGRRGRPGRGRRAGADAAGPSRPGQG